MNPSARTNEPLHPTRGLGVLKLRVKGEVSSGFGLGCCVQGSSWLGRRRTSIIPVDGWFGVQCLRVEGLGFSVGGPFSFQQANIYRTSRFLVHFGASSRALAL